MPRQIPPSGVSLCRQPACSQRWRCWSVRCSPFAAHGLRLEFFYVCSQAQDLIAFGSLRGWTFSAIPFTVPNLLAGCRSSRSLPGRPYYFASAPVQIIALGIALPV
ncbi:hypothetical protein IP86_19230 [Rhodopseudomonas sp. AAP120]|uniref:hypothetical protein n=1 Tax=Rhodopseudomonas sp. AAP120 TaxID=1523430 RepID=UPI0006B97DD6|nr:hypothetical protein [Rhodopseudomonas sp. AAP120]KPF95400.1 hypothetical protein IP86_19230 [Rhodopseudomonas sp. AAP120]